MTFDIKFIIIIYIILIVLLYIYKNQLFKLNGRNRSKKIIYLSSLFIILAIISIYIKILLECYFD